MRHTRTITEVHEHLILGGLPMLLLLLLLLMLLLLLLLQLLLLLLLRLLLLVPMQLLAFLPMLADTLRKLLLRRCAPALRVGGG